MKKCMNKFMSMVFAVILLTGMLSGCFQSADPNLASQPSTTAPAGVPTQIKTQPTTVSATEPTQVKTQPTAVPTQPSTVPTQQSTEPHYIEAEVLDAYGGAYMGLFGSSGVSRWPILIKSVQDIQDLADGDFAQPIRNYATILLNRYDDAFFEEYTVIITCYDPHIPHTGLRGAKCLKTQEGYYNLIIDLLGPTIGDYWVYDRILHAIAVKADIPKNAIIYVEIPEKYGKLILE